VNAFFDTSVLVAAYVPAHPRHERAFDRVRRARSGEYRMLTSAHCLAELYSVLTTLPLSPRISPGAAARIIRENLEGQAGLLPAAVDDYLAVIRRLGDDGLAGGIVYDALACQVAVEGGADVIFTFNAKDFRRALPRGGIRVEEP
jgi:predicted nucleic acid-binding protein